MASVEADQDVCPEGCFSGCDLDEPPPLSEPKSILQGSIQSEGCQLVLGKCYPLYPTPASSRVLWIAEHGILG